MATRRCTVLLSGGLDSAVALWWARKKFRGVEALTFTFSGRSARELRAARRLAREAGVALEDVAVPFLRERGPPRGRIPARNLVFYAIALARAEALGAGAVVGGHTREDPARFPDAGRPFFRKMERLAATGSRSPVRILTPLASLGKTEVVLKGLALGVPLSLTWSCYGNGPRPCGRCPACRERREAFRECGVREPEVKSPGPVHRKR
ncbi:MAG: 7-cyano-7-deazaguanine synthase [Halobacteria archaeon]